MNMTGRNFTRALLGIVAISAFTLAIVIAVAYPGTSESTAIAGTNTAPSEDGFGNTGIFAKFTANGTDIAGFNSKQNAGGDDVSDYTELVWASFSAGTPVSSTGLTTGRTNFEPFTIVKSIDKATPLLLQAMAQNQIVNVEILVFGNDPASGAERLEFRYLLSNGRIISQRTTSSTNTSNSAGEFTNTETIGIVFQTISMESPVDSVEFETSTNESS